MTPLRRIVCALTLSACLTVYATAQTTQHRCWDIDLGSTQTADAFRTPLKLQQQAMQYPYTLGRSDTGLALIAIARQYIGTPYRYGGRTPKGFDCAGFALFLYRQFGHDLPGWSGAQARLGTPVTDTRNLQPADLVFFGGRHNTKAVGHTGIVVESDAETGIFYFIHASTSAGVIISRSTEPYYAQRYLTACRILK